MSMVTEQDLDRALSNAEDALREAICATTGYLGMIPAMPKEDALEIRRTAVRAQARYALLLQRKQEDDELEGTLQG